MFTKKIDGFKNFTLDWMLMYFFYKFFLISLFMTKLRVLMLCFPYFYRQLWLNEFWFLNFIDKISWDFKMKYSPPPPNLITNFISIQKLGITTLQHIFEKKSFTIQIKRLFSNYIEWWWWLLVSIPLWGSLLVVMQWWTLLLVTTKQWWWLWFSFNYGNFLINIKQWPPYIIIIYFYYR
jgi:hypothetical protein